LIVLLLSPHLSLFFFHATSPPPISPLSLHDALPIFRLAPGEPVLRGSILPWQRNIHTPPTLHRFHEVLIPPRRSQQLFERAALRSEEHTSELQSRENLVCRLLLEKKKTKKKVTNTHT